VRNNTLALALVRAELCRAYAVEAYESRRRHAVDEARAAFNRAYRSARSAAPSLRRRGGFGDRTSESTPPD
jgi:hypothetical protein